VTRLERAGALDFRDRIWAAVRGFGTGVNAFFSVAEIMVLSAQDADTVTRTLAGLERAGYLAIDLAPPDGRAARRELRRFRLQRDVGVEAPRVYRDGKPITRSIGHDRMWRAMRTARWEFTWREIALHASTEDRPVAMHVAKDYIKNVARAGYLRVVVAAKANVPARYAFVRARDTGPRSPIVAEDKSVRDGNTGEAMLAAPGKKRSANG
jgi:hypothetical protein